MWSEPFANAGRGKGAEAAISAISAIPGLGDAVGMAYRVAKTGQLGVKVVGTSLKQTARGVVSAVAQNGAEQSARLYYGQQESFQWEQMAGAALSGGALGHLSVGVGRLNEASASFAKRTAYLAAGSGAAGALGDAAAQLGAMAAGRQDGFLWGQSATAFAGGALGAALGQAVFDRTCFRAGTPLVCEHGYAKVEDLKVGERLAARGEFDPAGPIEFKVIDEVFVRRGLILEVTVGGRTIGTTAEHPFYVHGRGWTPAGELSVGDLLASGDGRWWPVEKLYNTGAPETVYNFRIADHHTYFVGDPDWGFSVWVHNSYRGGRHGDMIKPVNDGLVSHHMPADSINGLPRRRGPAIQMDPADHKLTASHSGNGKPGAVYRAKQKALVRAGKFGAALQMDIDDIRSKFDSKYDDAIQQMIATLTKRMKVGLKG